METVLEIICGGLIAVAAFLLLGWIVNIFRSRKDPDVQAAADLRMSITRYRRYREWYDRHQELIRKYGIESKEEQEYFLDFFKKIKNPNEWRRYQAYRFEQTKAEWRKMTECE